MMSCSFGTLCPSYNCMTSFILPVRENNFWHGTGPWLKKGWGTAVVGYTSSNGPQLKTRLHSRLLHHIWCSTIFWNVIYILKRVWLFVTAVILVHSLERHSTLILLFQAVLMEPFWHISRMMDRYIMTCLKILQMKRWRHFLISCQHISS